MPIETAREEAGNEEKNREFQKRQYTFKKKVRVLAANLLEEYNKEIKISLTTYSRDFIDYIILQSKDLTYYVGLEISSKTKEIKCTIMKGHIEGKPIYATKIKEDHNFLKNAKKFIVTSLSASKQLNLPF